MAKTKTTELLLTCPLCEATCGMTIDTADMAVVECNECNEKVDPIDAVDTLRAASEKWARFADWLTAAGQV